MFDGCVPFAASPVGSSGFSVGYQVTLAGVDRTAFTNTTLVSAFKQAVALHVLLWGLPLPTANVSLVSVNDATLSAPCPFQVHSLLAIVAVQP